MDYQRPPLAMPVQIYFGSQARAELVFQVADLWGEFFLMEIACALPIQKAHQFFRLANDQASELPAGIFFTASE